MPTGPQIVITLKVLVVTVTVLLTLSMVALAMGRPKLHGQINLAFFVLTMITVLCFEGLLQVVPVSELFTPEARADLRVHLCFSVPSTLILPLMLATGKMHRRKMHIVFGIAFLVLWTGTVITGLGLPH
ncbi:hypothetical protein GobsT_00240 [Gemmata obscuriglobus]|uniref:DUF420 domain-containing protein n=1 Tax=Gemmata obscuriglobus TaxID=114 RepID=A0A2Z3HCQ1_9BACT|nr:hypothetical protein [Gemmata obscuriglobus]AWM41347.1 hypothetical protein C1280_33015 [Gemmata obscuriglobus]QEG25300.1 hypothetical protein GobsT_00240 [Gemmata obscuriglobus]VTR98162.1 unnamed protein product [Gemmata obscuriglobus UQM 2246]